MVTRWTINRWLCRLFPHEPGVDSWIEDEDVFARCRWCGTSYKLFTVHPELGPLSYTEIHND